LWPRTIARHAAQATAREQARQTITASLLPMLQAQIALATGVGYCYLRKNGKFTRVENLDEIDRLLRDGTEGDYRFIFAKDPSAAAFRELLARAIDKAGAPPQEIHLTGEIELSARLTAARTRVEGQASEKCDRGRDGSR
jgi:hypothetical protein